MIIILEFKFHILKLSNIELSYYSYLLTLLLSYASPPNWKLHPHSVKTTESGLSFYYFLSYFYFYFYLFFIFSILRTLGLGLEMINHISHIWWYSHNIDHRTWEKVVEGSRTSDVIQHGYHMLTSCTTHGCLG